MTDLNLLNINISYFNINEPNSPKTELILNSIPKENETFTNNTTEQLIKNNPITKNISKRNFKNVNIIPIEQDVVYINYIPEKILINDSEIKSIKNLKFEYFVEENYYNSLPNYNIIPNGSIFRIANEGIKSIELYTYYFLLDGSITKIPNFKTVQVLLDERQQQYSNIIIIEVSDFNKLSIQLQREKYIKDLINSGETEEDAQIKSLSKDFEVDLSKVEEQVDKTSSWNSGMVQSTYIQNFSELTTQSQSGAQAMALVTQQVETNLAALEAQANAAAAASSTLNQEQESRISQSEAAISSLDSRVTGLGG